MTGLIGSQCTVQHWYQQFPAGTNVHADNGDNLKTWSWINQIIYYLFLLLYLNVDYNVIHTVHMIWKWTTQVGRTTNNRWTWRCLPGHLAFTNTPLVWPHLNPRIPGWCGTSEKRPIREGKVCERVGKSVSSVSQKDQNAPPAKSQIKINNRLSAETK